MRVIGIWWKGEMELRALARRCRLTLQYYQHQNLDIKTE